MPRPGPHPARPCWSENRVEPANFLQKLHAVHARHLDIKHRQFDRTVTDAAKRRFIVIAINRNPRFQCQRHRRQDILVVPASAIRVYDFSPAFMTWSGQLRLPPHICHRQGQVWRHCARAALLPPHCGPLPGLMRVSPAIGDPGLGDKRHRKIKNRAAPSMTRRITATASSAMSSTSKISSSWT